MAKNKLNTVEIKAALVFMLAGGFFAILGCYEFFKTRSFVAHATEAHGVVIGYDNIGRGYAANVRYHDQNGEEFILYSRTGTRPPKFRIGESVTILYDPLDPYHYKSAEIKNSEFLWGMGIFFMCFGGFFFLFSIYALVYFIKRANGPNDSFGPTPLRGSP